MLRKQRSEKFKNLETKARLNKNLTVFFIGLMAFAVGSCSNLMDGFISNGLVQLETKTPDGGVISKLYRDRVLIDSFYRKNNFIEGTRFKIDTIDSVKIFAPYLKGKTNGVEKGYFMNSSLAYIVNYRNDTMIGECLFYYPNGKLRTYEFRNLNNGNLTYQRNYSANGNVIESKGIGLLQFNRVSDTIRVGEEYYCEVIIASPPKVNSVIMFADFTSDSIGENHFISTEVGHVRKFTQQYSKPGIYKKIIFWALEDSINGTIEKGRQVITINVLPK